MKTVEVDIYNFHPSLPSKTGLDDVVSKSQQDASGEHRNLLFSLESSVRGKEESLDPRSKSSNSQTSPSPEQSEGFLDRLAKQGRINGDSTERCESIWQLVGRRSVSRYLSEISLGWICSDVGGKFP